MADKLYVAPPMSVQEEDAVIHTRIINDEKALKRVAKKFHNFTSVASAAGSSPSSASAPGVDDAREAFLVELASFHLHLKKSLLVCEAEARQVEEYRKERERIASEHVALQGQIEQLKVSLEHAQLERRRKIDYDAVAEKVNTLPSREELSRTIDSLENDMTAIRAECDSQDRTLQAQKAALDNVITDLASLRVMGKHDAADSFSRPGSPSGTPSVAVVDGEDDVEMDGAASVRTREESGELNERGSSAVGGSVGADHDKVESEDEIPLSLARLNPVARPFVPGGESRTSTPLTAASTPAPVSGDRINEEDDIEMGEVAEDPRELMSKGKKKVRNEELEEGEASDLSSELSDPPDD